jgi:hypothetical protein
MFKEPEDQWCLPQGGAEYQYSDGTSIQTNPLLSIALSFLRPFGPTLTRKERVSKMVPPVVSLFASLVIGNP